MNKDKKEELRKLFSIIDEKKFIRFAKSYAGKDDAFADAIFEHFLPEDKPIDYEKLIAGCFAHKKKGRASSWKLNYDWAVIRRESKRVMKQLQIMVDGGDYVSAVDGVLLFLETLCQYFKEDNFDYDYNTYEGKDFSERTALAIVRKLLLSKDKELDKQEKLRVVERLKTIDRRRVIDEYLDGGVGRLISDAQEVLLDDEQMLAALDEKIATERYDHRRASLIIQKATLLNSMSRQEEAEELIRRNLHIEEIRKYDLDQLIIDGKFDEAVKKCDTYLHEKGNRTETWMEYKFAIGEKTGDKNITRTVLQWLCIYANANTDTKLEYCSRLKALCDKEQWLNIRETLIKDMVETSGRKELGFRLMMQEGLNERLYGYVSRLMSNVNSYDWNSTVGGELLKYYAICADAFTPEQQEALEKRIYDAILSEAAYSNKEKEYYGVKSGIRTLSEIRPEAHAKAVTLRDNLIRLYPRKPLFLSILKELSL
ncbi:MAG: hypothetical protein MJY59_05095 [Bacteroidaceae bacterium]|nr:hypothetical protein [Bacteroidaceae bacterium]